jgi:hypothetical protein
MSETPKIHLVKTEKTATDTNANARLSEADYLKLATEGVNRAGEIGPLSVDPDIAESMGAFWETGLADQDALDSHFDGLDPTAAENGAKDDAS